MAQTIDQALDAARRRLAAAPFQPALREAGLLLAQALSCTEVEVLSRGEKILTPGQQRRFERLLRRRLSGEPIAYLRGEKEFYGRSFAVDDRVLVPRPESEHLVEAALGLPLPERPSILDIGTGSGCLAVTLAAELPTAHLVASDLSAAALAVARCNVRRYRLLERVRLVAADLANGLRPAAFDLVISNPPYVGTDEAATLSLEVRDFEPEGALFAGPQGGRILARLLTELTDMRSGAWLLLEIGTDQGDLVRRLGEPSCFRLVQVRPDYAGRARVALFTRL